MLCILHVFQLTAQKPTIYIVFQSDHLIPQSGSYRVARKLRTCPMRYFEHLARLVRSCFQDQSSSRAGRAGQWLLPRSRTTPPYFPEPGMHSLTPKKHAHTKMTLRGVSVRVAVSLSQRIYLTIPRSAQSLSRLPAEEQFKCAPSPAASSGVEGVP